MGKLSSIDEPIGKTAVPWGKFFSRFAAICIMMGSKANLDISFPPERYFAVRRYTGASFSFDDSYLVCVADTSGQLNLWKLRPYNGPHGERFEHTQLTTYVNESVRAVYPSPVEGRLVFFADPVGSENFQCYTLNLESGWPARIAGGSGVRCEPGAECFNHTGDEIVYASNEGSPANMLPYVHNLRTGLRRKLTERPGYYSLGHWSPDDSKISLTEVVSVVESAIWVVDAKTGELAKVSPEAPETRFYTGPWTRDGKGIYIISDFGREHTGIAILDTQTKTLAWLDTPSWDVEDMALSKDGRVLVYSINAGGYSEVYVRTGDKPAKPLQSIPRGVVHGLSISNDSRRLAFLASTARSADDIYVVNFRTRKPIKLTESMLGHVPKEYLLEPVNVQIRSFDGLEIPAFYYEPRSDGRRFGGLLSIHGGPQSQERPSYAYGGLYQFLLSRGIAILAINFRGSSGYGKSFERKIFHDWGGAELRDFEAAARWLGSRPNIDSGRLGVFGGSFGGFATLSCVTRLPDYWKAGVDIVGPSNLITFAKAVPPHWKRLMAKWVGDPDTEAEFLASRSPIGYVQNVRANMLIIQGANDPRVVKGESDQMVEKLRELGRRVEYVVYQDEGHGFTKNSNFLDAIGKAARFLAEELS